MEKDPKVASKTAPFLSRLYHTLERTFAGIKEKERKGYIYPFVGLKTLQYSKEQSLFSPKAIGRELRIGFLPIAINPLNWGHILIAFMAINALSLDTVIFRGRERFAIRICQNQTGFRCVTGTRYCRRWCVGLCH